jgi:hypothetical protein
VEKVEVDAVVGDFKYVLKDYHALHPFDQRFFVLRLETFGSGSHE